MTDSTTENVRLTEAENAVDGWNTEGRLPGCQTDWTPDKTPGPGHILDCQCPPYICHDCGQTQPQREACACFTSLEGMPLADLKAIFATINLSVEKE